MTGSNESRPVSSRTAASKAGAKAAKSLRPSVRPAAMAWPPNLRIRLGLRLDTRSSASRRCTSGIERPEPRISSSPAGAKASVGRQNFSFRREATRPTTPWCQPGSNTQTVAPAAALGSSIAASACSRISASMVRRSRLMLSSSRAISSAWASSSVVRQAMPRLMSARRPAALMRGPSAKPRSKPLALRGSRPATANRARRPGCRRPARMRCRPCVTSRRLLASSLTTSATVPSATRSDSASSLGPPSAA